MLENHPQWAESEHKDHPIHFSHIRHNYRLTPPNLSAATHFVLPTDFKQQMETEDEQLYLQSNLPYLILLAIVFIVNGFILFFGQDIKAMLRADEQTTQTETTAPIESFSNLSGSTWGGYDNQALWFLPEDTRTINTAPAKENKETPADKTQLFQ